MTTTPTPMDLRRTNTYPPRCEREGCPRPKAKGRNRFCTELCYLVSQEMKRAEEMCREAGDGPASTELWVSAVALADALSEYAKAQHTVRRLLLSR